MRSIIIKLRSTILVMLTHKVALPLLKKIRKPLPFTFTEKELAELPAGTLGNDLYVFLKKRNLELLKHYSRHDMKHILLDYDTTDKGEACLQCFMLGNGRISFPVLATVTYGFITMPEYWCKMKEAYLRGKKSNPIHPWKWNELLKEPTKELRRKINSGI